MARKKPEPKKKPTPAPAKAKAAPQAAPAAAKSRARRAPAAPAPAATPDLRPGPVPVFGNIPWDYGRTRITAIARDPSCVFAYWEFPDDALRQARERLQAPDAGPVLRVYDTTFRLFDGTNANGYFDVPVDRNTNRYYLHLNRPATVFVIDIGAKSGDRFSTIARSGAAETPRDSYSPDHRAEWMTVPATESFRPYRHRFTPRPGSPAPPPPPPPPAAPHFPSPDVVRETLIRDGWTEESWTEKAPDGNSVRWIRWSGPVRTTETVIHFPGKTFEKFTIEFASEPWIVQHEKGERRVFGPWNVAFYAWEKRTGKQLLQRWTLHSSWITEERSIRTEIPVIVYQIVGGMRTRSIAQGSESRLARESWSSEMLLGGASEMRWLGGSELMMAGSSETLFQAASEWMAAGSSEWLSQASSAVLMQGGSERWGEYAGASERWADFKSGNPLFPPGGEKP